MYKLVAVRHSWPEQKESSMTEASSTPTYAFLHFYDSVDIIVDGHLVTTKPHACILYTPGIKYRFTSEITFLYDWFFFVADESLPDDIPCNTLFYPTDHNLVTSIIWEMEKEFYTQKMYRDTVIDLKIQELLIKLSRTDERRISPVINRQTRFVLQDLRNELLSNLSEPKSLTQLSQKAFLSPSQFYTIYRTMFGKSPKEDLIAAKMHAAANELLGTKKPLSAIAENLGYSNTSYFSRQFHQHFGVSPTAYRKTNGLLPENTSPRQPKR